MLRKQSTTLTFAQGIDTKSDPKQVQFGKFNRLVNSIFGLLGAMKKRNGYGELSVLPNPATYVTTFGGNLTAIGRNVQAYSQGTETWVSKGNIQPLTLNVKPSVRSSLSQTQCDSVVSPNGYICTVYSEINNTTTSYSVSVQDVATGQNLLKLLIPGGSGVVTGSPRVFLLGGYFILVYTNVISGTSHLQYINISTSDPTGLVSTNDLVSAYTPATTLSWDGIVVGNNLYIAYNAVAGGQHVGVLYMTSSLVVSAPHNFAGQIATVMSMTADLSLASAPVIYATYYDFASKTGFAVAVDQNLNVLMNPTSYVTTVTVPALTTTAQNGLLRVIYEVANNYTYDSALPTDFLNTVSITQPATVTTGTVSSTATFTRSVGLASKGFLMNGTMYVLTSYQSSLQPTYFLMDSAGNIISRFAYENGGGYLKVGLPTAQVSGTRVYISYLYKDLISTANTLNLTPSIGTVGLSNIYSQTGVNYVAIDFTDQTLSTSEIGANLNISGGMLWAYDGQTLNEQGFHLFPDNVELSTATGSGSITAQQYYYVALYQWTDSQGNIIRSAPSIPVTITTTTTSSTNTINVPTLRLTYKPSSDVKIILYRWSQANQVYYQVSSILTPTLNNAFIDSVTITDNLADSSILGNAILYTTGGVLENIAGPAFTATALFDNRLWGIQAEDQNLLWNSKQVIESVPVEMSDLLTTYVAPSTGAQGSTGVMHCIYPMDDKLVIFKKDAAYYLNGSGPDNTGANSQYSQPIFITASVGCANQRSIVLIPNGLMFQSDKGIWLLGRDLSTSYIGADVEEFNSATVNSAISVPGTTQVRFTLSTGITLMYDYYVGQWGIFEGVPAVSATLYQDQHTFINAFDQVAQETPGIYLDLGNPVLMSFQTNWFNLAGLQGYQRAYFFYILGQYLTPHTLQLGIAYDYNDTFISAPLIEPDNYTPAYGAPAPYGQGQYGGVGDLERWRVFFEKQRCQAFRIALQEVYDASLGVQAGEGIIISGLNLIFGIKSQFRPTSTSHTVG